MFYSFNFVLFKIQNSLLHLASIFGLNFQDGLFLNDHFWKTFWIIFQVFLQASRKSGHPRADLHGVGEVIDFDSWIFLVQTRSCFLADLKSITLFQTVAIYSYIWNKNNLVNKGGKLFYLANFIEQKVFFSSNITRKKKSLIVSWSHGILSKKMIKLFVHWIKVKVLIHLKLLRSIEYEFFFDWRIMQFWPGIGERSRKISEERTSSNPCSRQSHLESNERNINESYHFLEKVLLSLSNM